MLVLSLVLSAHSAELHVEAGESIQAVLNEAEPGDRIVIAAGTYDEDLSTESSGEEDAPITVAAAEPGAVIITHSGEVLQVDHPYWVFEDLIFDGQFGTADVLDINDDANHLTLARVEVRRSSRDCIDLGAPTGVRITHSTVHHCLHYDIGDESRQDAHGIVAGAVRDLQIIETDIHTFSGDGLQLDPDREEPGWDNVRVERSRIWLEPLTEDTNGFLAGQVPGENAIDTKTIAGGERANLTIEDSEVWGFRNGVDFSNQAALLFKENVNAVVRRTHIHGSEIGLRVRGPSDTRPEGAHVRVVSSLIDDVDVGVRFEDDITRLQLWHITFGANIGEMFRRVESDLTEVNVLNSLFVGDELPDEATDAETNASASSDDFVDLDGGDYHLADGSAAIDRGSPITGVTQDMDGNDRTVGDAPDIGAYEWGQVADTGDPDGDTGFDDTGTPDDPEPDPDDDADDTDTGVTEMSPPADGIGAADAVGEKGGCGCAAQSQDAPWAVLLMMVGTVWARRRRHTMTHGDAE